MTTEIESILIVLTGLTLPIFSFPVQITPIIHPICPDGPYPHIISDQYNHLQIPSNQYVICTGRQSPLIFTCSPGHVFDTETHGCIPVITPHNPNRHQFPPNTKPYIPAAPVPPPVQKPEHKIPCDEKPHHSYDAHSVDDSPMQKPFPVDIPILRPDPIDENPIQRPEPVDIPILRPPIEFPILRPHPVDDTPMQRPYPVDIPILRPQPGDDTPVQRPYPVDIPILRPQPVDDTPVQRPYPVDIPILRPDPVEEVPIQKPYPDDYPVHWPFPPMSKPYPIDYYPRPFPIKRIPIRNLYPSDQIPPLESPTPVEVEGRPPVHSRPIFEHQSEPVHERPMYDPRDPNIKPTRN